MASRKTKKMEEEMSKESNDLTGLLDGSHPRNRLGSLRRFAVTAPAAIRAYDLGILFGHFVQEGGKRLATVLTQKINLIRAHICSRRCSRHRATSDLLSPSVADSYPSILKPLSRHMPPQ
jgi:hypothetical protein